MQAHYLALKHSANAFLNSLFREWRDFTHDQLTSSFVIELETNHELVIPLTYFSFIGRHEYAQVFLLKQNNEMRELNFYELIEVLLGHLSTKYKTVENEKNLFKNRIHNSVKNIELAIDQRVEELEAYATREFSFLEAEQSLIIGHTFHPHPKSREEFSDEDYKTYAPEMRGEFYLEWFLVKPERLHQHISENFAQKRWSEELFLLEFGEMVAGYIPFPVHPWQKAVLLKHPAVIKGIEKKTILDYGKTFYREKWGATSSLRSIYRETSPYMLKFSMSVRLTNSIRHLLPHEVVRGLQVMDVFSTPKGKEFLETYPDFNIVFEPAFMAILDEEKKIINESIVSLRENPFEKKNAEGKYVLATLTQDHPLEGKGFIGKMVRTPAEGELWLQKYLECAIKPLLMAQADYGVYLGAHQQNLIIDIKNNLPHKAYFRDCQGTGYSPVGYELFSRDVDLMTKENGNVLEKIYGNSLFAYYLIINSTFNVISAIARETKSSEEKLVLILRDKLLAWRSAGVKDSSCLDYLLDEKELLQKGNFLCSFVNMNENTTENPLGIYNHFPNPIYLVKNESSLC